jgi:hypothetical protein
MPFGKLQNRITGHPSECYRKESEKSQIVLNSHLDARATHVLFCGPSAQFELISPSQPLLVY